MKFIHMADMHFDSSFVNLSDKDIMGDLRRLEQRKAFRKVIEYIKENEIKYFFISGDFYEHKYIKKSTIEYINNLFKEIPETKIFIAPGNHDPKIKNSYYNKFEWNENVHIFGSKIETIEFPEVDIYGFGFDDYYCTKLNIEELKIENKNKLNILVIHGSLDGGNDENKQYNPLKKKELEELGFDYIALGHIHKRNFVEGENEKIIYPGSTVSLGFDELGKHGMIVGKIEKDKKLEIAFVPIPQNEFIEQKIDITIMLSQEEIIEKINELELQEKNYYKIVLVGKRGFLIDTKEIQKYINNKNIIKIKDITSTKLDLDELSKQHTLRGIFVKNMLQKMNDDNKEQIIKAIEIGLENI